MTRRAISLRGETIARLKILAEREGASVCGLVEDIIEADMTKRGVRSPIEAFMMETLEFAESISFEGKVEVAGLRSWILDRLAALREDRKA